MTGTSVLAIQYRDGIMMAADNLGELFLLIAVVSLRLNSTIIHQRHMAPLHVSRMSNVCILSAITPSSAQGATCPISNTSKLSLMSSWLMNLPHKTGTPLAPPKSTNTSPKSCTAGGQKWIPYGMHYLLVDSRTGNGSSFHRSYVRTATHGLH